MDQPNTTSAIAELNDRFRRQGPSSGIPGQVLMTAGIANLPLPVQVQIQRTVTSFESFSEGDDPYGEHDFGAVDVAGAGKVFWKIDYYAPDMEHGSEDPADPARTVRVLTVMLASEY